MSGRTRIKRDGEWITGYRKTDRRNPRRAVPVPAPRMEYSLRIQLPTMLSWSVSPGSYSSFVTVDRSGVVTVASFDKRLTISRARSFLKSIDAGMQIDVAIGDVVERRVDG